MKSEHNRPLQDRLHQRLALFFADMVYSSEMIEEALDNGDIFYKPLDILPFLQTALLDEKIVEVELNGITQIYFSRVHDHPPDTEKEEETNAVPEASDYSPGDYLKTMSHLITLPLEPGMGNYSIRFSSRILLRFFTATYAVELGTFFQETTAVKGLPVLRLDYPAIGRIVRGSREYRAKVPENMDIKIIVVGRRRQKTITTRLLDVSASGFAFAITKEQQDLFRIDEKRSMEIVIGNIQTVRINGLVRHISKIRGKKGTEYICGIHADLETRAVAAQLEGVVAAVQRAHLRELSELSMTSGINLLT